MDQQLSQVSSLLGDFKDHKLEYENSDAEKGIIIRQDPAAGEDIIVKDTVVTLVISEGKKTVKLTNLSNYSNSALEEYTQRHKLKWKIVDERTSETIPKGSVISHKPSAGEEVEEGKTIEVVISSGPPAKKTNFRTIEIEIPYEPIFNEEGEEEYREQTIHIYIQDKNNKMHELYDTLTITATTKYSMNFEIEEGSEAAYRIDRDSFKIADGTIPYSN